MSNKKHNKNSSQQNYNTLNKSARQSEHTTATREHATPRCPATLYISNTQGKNNKSTHQQASNIPYICIYVCTLRMLYVNVFVCFFLLMACVFWLSCFLCTLTSKSELHDRNSKRVSCISFQFYSRYDQQLLQKQKTKK